MPKNLKMRILTIGALLATLSCPAQVNTATVYGTVADTSNAVLPAAKVILTSNSTGVVRTANSNQSGQFTFSYVPRGRYTLRVDSPGFESQEVTDVDLAAAQTVEQDFILKLLSVQQAVVVTAAEPYLELGSSEQRASISSTQLNRLPAPRRDWTGILNTNPGISVMSNSVVMNGLPGSAASLTVDGTNSSSNPEVPAFSQGINIINTVNSDAIEEVSIVHGIAPASVGNTMSGNVNIITKGGTNEFHGNLYEINSENIYNARNQFSVTRPRLTFNQFGGSLGGPILRKKLFFFGSYGGARSSSFTTISGAVPTPYLFTQLSPAALKLYAPVFARFPPTVQPSSSPTATSVTIHQNSSAAQKDNNTVARLDYDLNSNNLLTVRYTRARPYSYSPRVVADNPRVTTGHQDAYNAQWTHSAGTWLSNTRFGYNRTRSSRNDLALGKDLEQVVFGFDTGGAELFNQAGSVYTGEERISYTHGRHSFEIGGILQRQNSGRQDLNAANLSYSSLSDFNNNIPSGVTITFDLNPFSVYIVQAGGFVQDDFKINPKLTFNLGLRYDYNTVAKEVSGRLFNRGIDPARPQLGPGYGSYLPVNSVYDADYANFVPRLGFSWAVDSESLTVLRGGFGIFKGQHTIIGGLTNLVQNSPTAPFRVSLNRAQALAAGINYPLPRSSFNNILTQLQASGVLSSNFSNATVTQYFPNPYSEQWTLGVQRLLPLHSVLTIDYVGNRALHENITYTKNLPDRNTGIAPSNVSQFRLYSPQDVSSYHGLQTSLYRRFEKGVSLNVSYTYSKVLSLESAEVITSLMPQDNDNILADYGPAPFDLRHNFVASGLWDLPLLSWGSNHGLLIRELLGGWEISGIVRARTGNPANLINGRSSYPSDRPDVLPGTKVYREGYGLSQLQYINPSAFLADPAGFAAGTNPNLNPSLFIVKASGAQNRGGNASRNLIFGPGAWTLDGSLGKTFAIEGVVNFQLRMEAFNALNHTNLDGLDINLKDTGFGNLTSATARTVQISGKLNF